jgi:opacity protein-like surface antigen
MIERRWGLSLVGATLVVLALVVAGPALAYDPAETFKKGTYVLSLEGGGGAQHNIEGQSIQTGLEFWNAGIRLGLIPWGPINKKAMYGAFEIGLEPYYQGYEHPLKAHFAGLGLSLRYHFLALGRFVPYVEAFGAAGETDLKTPEVASRFTFLLHGGLGVEYFVSNRVALYVGYRLQHVSNGNTDSPNRGFESHTGVTGISDYFP